MADEQHAEIDYMNKIPAYHCLYIWRSGVVFFDQILLYSTLVKKEGL